MDTDPKNTNTLIKSHQVAKSRVTPFASSWHMFCQHHPAPSGYQDMFRGHTRSSKDITSFATPGRANCSWERLSTSAGVHIWEDGGFLGERLFFILPFSYLNCSQHWAPAHLTAISPTVHLVCSELPSGQEKRGRRCQELVKTLSRMKGKWVNIKYLLC